MKYTPELLSELGIELEHKVSELTMAPQIIIKTKDKSFSYGITREHIEDLRWQTPVPLSDEEIGDYLINSAVDSFLIRHPKYLRRVKLEKIEKLK